MKGVCCCKKIIVPRRILLAIAAAVLLGSDPSAEASAPASTRAGDDITSLATFDRSMEALVARVTPAVVNITVTATVTAWGKMESLSRESSLLPEPRADRRPVDGVILKFGRRGNAMTNEPENPKTPEVEDSKSARTHERERIKRLADKAAAKGSETERRYDQQHGTFPRGGPSGMA